MAHLDVVACNSDNVLYIWRARVGGVGHFDSTTVDFSQRRRSPQALRAFNWLILTHLRFILSDTTTKLAYFFVHPLLLKAFIRTTWRLQHQAVKLAVP